MKEKQKKDKKSKNLYSENNGLKKICKNILKTGKNISVVKYETV